ncbi:MAG: hypothetical protein M1827_006692 [Pycnora praestabilis]|nr:MAG: hypothetical protein M1827_006692 [Pycnora praestabilis]
MVSHRSVGLSQALANLYVGRDQVAWYWRFTAFAAAWLILAGFLILPAAFDGEAKLNINKGAISIYAITALVVGYVFSVLLPGLASSSLGLVNILYNITVRRSQTLNAASTTAVTLAAITTIVYGIAALITLRKVTCIRHPEARQISSIANQDNSYLFLPEEELTRQQLLRLLMQKDADRAPSPAASQETFHIDLPESPSGRQDRSGYLTMPSPSFGGRSRSASASAAPHGLNGWSNELEFDSERERLVQLLRQDDRVASRDLREVEIEMGDRR